MYVDVVVNQMPQEVLVSRVQLVNSRKRKDPVNNVLSMSLLLNRVHVFVISVALDPK